MRKYNEGYVLPLVLVVLVVLCTVSLSVMAPAVSNLKVQEASIQRMQDRYEVLGKAKESVDSTVRQAESLSGYITQENNDAGLVITDLEKAVQELVAYQLGFKTDAPNHNTEEQTLSAPWTPVEGATSPISFSLSGYDRVPNDTERPHVQIDLTLNLDVNVSFYKQTVEEKTFYCCYYSVSTVSFFSNYTHVEGLNLIPGGASND